MSNLKDTLNPEYIFSGTNTKLLSDIVLGKIDVFRLAKKELANRGQNADGRWVGFQESKKLFGF